MQTCSKMFDCVQYDIQLPVRAVLCTDVSMCRDHAVCVVKTISHRPLIAVCFTQSPVPERDPGSWKHLDDRL